MILDSLAKRAGILQVFVWLETKLNGMAILPGKDGFAVVELAEECRGYVSPLLGSISGRLYAKKRIQRLAQLQL